MTTANDILKQIKDNDVKFVDLRFTDPKGKLHHLTMDVGCVDEDMFADGVMFDGSSIGGWKGYQRIRHGSDARSGHRAHGSFLCAVHDGDRLRYSRPGLRRSL